MKGLLIIFGMFLTCVQLNAQNTIKHNAGITGKNSSRHIEVVRTCDEITPKTDKVFFLNGSTKEGKILGFENDLVHFVHNGETLNYDFKRSDIEKIEFTSGRTEVIHQKRTELVTADPGVTKNNVAVLPMGYTADASETKMEEMRFRLQEMTIAFLSQSAAELKFQDPVSTNANLLKAGINEDNIRQYTPKELANVLQVEYIILGNVMQDAGTLITVSNTYHSSKQNVEERHREARYRGRSNSNSVTSTNQQVETEVSLSVYNEMGEMLYSKSRHSLLSDMNAYKATLRYMLKRTPLYER